MVQVSRRTGVTGSTLVRLLARLADTDAPESKQAFADRLSQWLGWTDAISLSAALSGSPATARSGAAADASAERAQCARVRSAAASAIAEDMRGAAMDTDTTTGFSPWRQRYLARQQAMATSIGALRGRLRETLAARSPAMARLAAVDAVMEQVLGAHEHRLLATVPALLEKHFKRLRPADPAQDAPDNSEVQPQAWLDVFGQDMQSVLLAELDIRLQPVEGLLEALATR
ncbi:DUF3348 domain-containing protein [Variovorax sp. RT4R15]|uniref:DUF3348 domain-containing protein n=1 Tax=Variovorax sp. RT4R15 TaxID=3443737 RepID=UPI003F46DE93